MMVRNSGVSGGSLRLPANAEDSTPASPVFARARRTQTVRYRRRSKRQGPSISQLVPVLLEGKAAESRLLYDFSLQVIVVFFLSGFLFLFLDQKVISYRYASSWCCCCCCCWDVFKKAYGSVVSNGNGVTFGTNKF